MQSELAEAPVQVWIVVHLAQALSRHGSCGHRQLLLRSGAAANRLYLTALRCGLTGTISAGLVAGAARKHLSIDGFDSLAVCAVFAGLPAPASEGATMSAAAEVTEPRNNAARAPLVAFFSRGRGSGHVVPDMEIIDLLAESGVRCTVKSITYGTGAAVMRERGREHIDLGLPDENPFLETQLRVTRTVARLKPDLVIAHEEYAAMPAARLLGVPGIFITDYFVSQQHLWMQCLAYANEILFIDNAGTFEEPDYLKARTVYCGPFCPALRIYGGGQAAGSPGAWHTNLGKVLNCAAWSMVY